MSSIQPEVHNVAQRHRRKTEARPQGICIQNFVPIGPAVPEICSRHTDRQTHGQTGWSRYTAPLPGSSNYSLRFKNISQPAIRTKNISLAPPRSAPEYVPNASKLQVIFYAFTCSILCFPTAMHYAVQSAARSIKSLNSYLNNLVPFMLSGHAIVFDNFSRISVHRPAK